MIYKYLPLIWLPFHFVDAFLCYAEVFLFAVAHLFIFGFVSLSFVADPKPLRLTKGACSLCFSLGLLWLQLLYSDFYSIFELTFVCGIR